MNLDKAHQQKKNSPSDGRRMRPTNLHIQESHENTELKVINISVEDLVQAGEGLVRDVPIFVTSYESCFIDLEGLVPLVSSIPSDSNTPFASSMGPPDTWGKGF